MTSTSRASGRGTGSGASVRALTGACVAAALVALALPSADRDATGPSEGTAARALALLGPSGGFACDEALDPAIADAVTAGTTGTSVGASAAAPLQPRLVRLRASLYEADAFERARGTGERVECLGGADGAARAVAYDFGLDRVERTRTLAGDVVLNALETDRRIRAVARDERRVDGGDGRRGVGLPAAGAWVPAPDGAGLVAAHDARRAGAGCTGTATGRCTVALEIGWRLRTAGRGVALERATWVNGRPAERLVWRLGS